VAGSRSPRLRVAISPRTAYVRERRTFSIRVSAFSRGKRRAERRAVVTFGGRRVRTNSRGRARVSIGFNAAGRYRAVATQRNRRAGYSAWVTVRAR